MKIDEQKSLEIEVRRIANELWPSALGGGSDMFDGKERDGVFITEDSIHLIECTTSRSKAKAIQDVKKLTSLVKEMRKHHPDKAIKGFFITKSEPTADQRSVANNSEYSVYAISLEKFQARLIDVAQYRNCRDNYPFGSVRDPQTGQPFCSDEYIPVDLVNIKDESEIWKTTRIVDELVLGKRIIVVQGHYGAGKSMTLKEINSELFKKYESKELVTFPIYINLRDHQGQTNPVEAIERHARYIGFKNPEHLVRTWRAGYATIILDGFDEIAAFGWTGKTATLKDVRYRSMELLREFIRQKPSNSGLLIAGRINYFDSIKECENAFGISQFSSVLLNVGDFTETQVGEFLKRKGVALTIPSWVPSRALLLSYLVAKQVLPILASSEGAEATARGWEILITEISKREALIEAGLSPDTFREIFEKAACYTRRFQNGLGPIYQTDLEGIFAETCGYPPDERALVLLQRMPGLAPTDQQDGSRHFIDESLASVAKAGEVVRYIQNPYTHKFYSDCRQWQESLDSVGIESVSNRLEDENSSSFEEAILVAIRQDYSVLATDVLCSLNYLGYSWNRESVTYHDVIIPSIELKKELDWSNIRFKEVIFRELYLEELPEIGKSPVFNTCIVGKLYGCTDTSLLSPEIFQDCIIDGFEIPESTTSALLKIEIPIAARVGLTILKKLYLQAGNGRQENAFYRGLSTNEQRYVAPVLELFRQDQIAICSKRSGTNRVWQPVKSQFGRMRNILLNRAYSDPILAKLSSLLS